MMRLWVGDTPFNIHGSRLNFVRGCSTFMGDDSPFMGDGRLPEPE